MSERVLIVDDDPVIRELLKAVLTRENLGVLEASDGLEGMELIRSERPDLVLTDISMPVMDGFELVRQVRADPLLSGVPLVILSAKGEEEDKIKGLELGANDYLTKPFSGKELATRVKNLIRYVQILRTSPAPSPQGPFAASNLQHLAQLTFETFVVGTGNRAAYEACRAVVGAVGARFNPLFLYGGPGLGKTHLMCAVANEVFRTNPSSKILYLSSEHFSSQVVEAYRDRRVERLRDQYLSLDLLLLDDIQFLGISPSMQTVAAEIFSLMYDKGKQIIVSSDRRPEDIPELAAEITGAFSSGLVVRLDHPDATLRTNILRALAERNHWDVDGDLLDYLASRLASDLRTLTGVAKRLVAMRVLSGITLTRELVDKAIAEVQTPEEPGPAPAPSEPVDDPLAQEFGHGGSLVTKLGTLREAMETAKSMAAQPLLVLGSSTALVIDTVHALAGAGRPPHPLPEGAHWGYWVHRADGTPSWIVVGVGEWRDLAAPEYVRWSPRPVCLVVMDSLSPKVMEARDMMKTLKSDWKVVVTVLVPTLSEDASARTLEKLSGSMRRLFNVSPSVPLFIGSKPSTGSCRRWVYEALRLGDSHGSEHS